MEGRIDVVRPAFEPLYPQAAPGKGPHERDARRGLALARTGRGDAEGVECRMLHRLFPFPDASKRLSNRDSIHAKVLGERGWGFREGKLFFRRVLLPNSNLLHILLNIPPRLVHGPGVRDRARAADDDEGGHIHLVGGEIVEPADPFGLLRPSSMSDIGAQYVASALFPENVERFREQMPPFAPGGIVERHRQGLTAPRPGDFAALRPKGQANRKGSPAKNRSGAALRAKPPRCSPP